MADKTKIEWTDSSWNPTRGCSLVSAGCTNCYAMKVAGGVAKAAYAGLTRQSGGRTVWTGEVRLVPEMLDQPLRWKRPRRIFVDSMSDLFHPDVPDNYIARVFAVMAGSQRHTYQVLTKRPERAAELLNDDRFWGNVWMFGMESFWDDMHMAMLDVITPTEPLPNVWLGTSVEDQAAADERIPHLLRTPAAVRFLSCEPLLGAIDLRLLRQQFTEPPHRAYALDWVIVGGESGPNARPCDVSWIRDIVRQCHDAAVPCFVKQLGARPRIVGGEEDIDFLARTQCTDGENVRLGEPYTIALKDRKGGDWDEWPNDLRVREFPA